MDVHITILTDNVEKAKSQAQIINEMDISGHLDVIDGEFAQAMTVKPGDLEKELEINWECHLMVDNPIDWVEECAGAGVGRAIGQIERMGNQKEFVEQVQQLQMEAGLGLDLDTEVEALDSDALVWVESVLVMGVKAGKSGQSFEDKVVGKIEELVSLREAKGYGFLIEVDGGVNVEVAERLKVLGVDAVAVHSAFWEGDREENWESLKKL